VKEAWSQKIQVSFQKFRRECPSSQLAIQRVPLRNRKVTKKRKRKCFLILTCSTTLNRRKVAGKKSNHSRLNLQSASSAVDKYQEHIVLLEFPTGKALKW